MADLTITVDKVGQLKETHEFLRDNYILVGIPQKETTREGDSVTNAELLYIHTYGSKINNNIPKRPVIEPAIRHSRDKLAEMLSQSFKYASEGDYVEAEKKLNLTGMKAQKVCREWFYDPENGWPPNSPATVARKIKKGSTEPRPLIDTDEMHKSITYVMVKEGRRIDYID